MKDFITNIWISIETKGFITGKQMIDENTDVIVTLSSGKQYVATFFTYQNIRSLTEKNQRTGEWLSGKYFWASDMLLIDTLDRENIERVISHLFAEGIFFSIFDFIN